MSPLRSFAWHFLFLAYTGLLIGTCTSLCVAWFELSRVIADFVRTRACTVCQLIAACSGVGINDCRYLRNFHVRYGLFITVFFLVVAVALELMLESFSAACKRCVILTFPLCQVSA